MEIHCTRPHCPRPQNFFAELDQKATLQTAQQRYCTACGIPLKCDRGNSSISFDVFAVVSFARKIRVFLEPYKRAGFVDELLVDI
ncbi:4-Cys prefix domain-containing protein [Coleofasciculus sp.]|uniref:4-Cys prefix domain-containing protein n=1 Tax=Coleofasciculus sp. TaxID=3100458 RepID=UPI003A1BC0B0